MEGRCGTVWSLSCWPLPNWRAFGFIQRAFIRVLRMSPLSELSEDVALMIDMASIFSSSKPRADSGFAMLAAVFQTPLVLIASGGAIAAIVFWKHLPPRAGATEAH